MLEQMKQDPELVLVFLRMSNEKYEMDIRASNVRSVVREHDLRNALAREIIKTMEAKGEMEGFLLGRSRPGISQR